MPKKPTQKKTNIGFNNSLHIYEFDKKETLQNITLIKYMSRCMYMGAHKNV